MGTRRFSYFFDGGLGAYIYAKLIVVNVGELEFASELLAFAVDLSWITISIDKGRNPYIGINQNEKVFLHGRFLEPH